MQTASWTVSEVWPSESICPTLESILLVVDEVLFISRLKCKILVSRTPFFPVSISCPNIFNINILFIKSDLQSILLK